MTALDRIKRYWALNTQTYLRLVMVNVAFSITVWLIALLMGSSSFAQVPDSFAELALKPYTLLTYMFAHAGLWHLLGNMLILYFVGNVFEDLLGKKKTLYTYLLSGLIGAIAFTAVVFKNSSLIGASGAVMGLLYGLTVLRPNYQFYLYGILKLKLWWVTVAFAAYDLMMVLITGGQAGGQLCHIVGGLTGALLVWYWNGNLQFNGFKKRSSAIEPYRMTVNRKPNRPTRIKQKPLSKPSRVNRIPSQEEIDYILDKINESGYDNLSQTEKELLFRAKDIEV